MHIERFDNRNTPIVGANHPVTPLAYFNIVKLSRGESFSYVVPGYETCIVPVQGTIDVTTAGKTFSGIGEREKTVWDADPAGVYVPVGREAKIVCRSGTTEVFVSGARHDEVYDPFDVRSHQLDTVQYGSDETKTHRKIKHILGQRPPGRVGRLLVSELFTVGAGGWSGFPPHKHDTNRPPLETHHDEIYNFRFNPVWGFGMQLVQNEDMGYGKAFHVRNGSTILLAKGYHPCVAAPGYEMYYFTILAGETQRPLVQFFQPEHAYQVETIPGIKDMIAKFK